MEAQVMKSAFTSVKTACQQPKEAFLRLIKAKGGIFYVKRHWKVVGAVEIANHSCLRHLLFLVYEALRHWCLFCCLAHTLVYNICFFVQKGGINSCFGGAVEIANHSCLWHFLFLVYEALRHWSIFCCHANTWVYNICFFVQKGGGN